MSDLVFAVVVARAGAGAKSRLAQALTPDQRRDLVLAMLADVLDVCQASPVVHAVIAVVDSPAARRIATTAGASVVDDPAPAGMNAAVAAGISAACAGGANTAIVLPADIPTLTTADLQALLAAATGAPRAVAVGASRDGLGTNALLLRPPDAIQPSFGPPSLERHRALALAANCHTVVLPSLALSLDIDTPEDLATLRALPNLPPHTAAFLASKTLIC